MRRRDGEAIMKYRKLGNTGLFVSEIAYGSWLTLGNQVASDKSEAIVRRALELGVNYVDTADVYSKGRAEELLGKVLPGRVRRQDYILATKVYFPMGTGVNDRGLSRKHIFDSIHDSLRRLNQEYVDIYYCHRYDENTPVAESIQAMQDLIHQGKIMHWGVSQWTADQITEAATKCKANGWIPPAVDQAIYSLLNRGIEKRVLPVCAHHGLGVAVFSPLAQGNSDGQVLRRHDSPDGSRGSMESLNMFMREHLSDGDVLGRVDRLAR
jgi:aryl-alcohol dehydrogenase-like predicted oxidoreductase